MDKPAGVPVDFSQHVHLMFDLMTIAFQADLTRIVTFMMGRKECSNLSGDWCQTPTIP